MKCSAYILYCLFLGGRRGNLSLAHTLQFATGDDEEPILGYKIRPCLMFVEAIGNIFFALSQHLH